MTGKVVIRQLWDEQKEKTPTVQDVKKELLRSRKTWEYRGRKYVTYRNREDETPYENQDYVTWRNLTEKGRYRIPVKFVESSNGSRKRTVNRSKLIHDIFQLQEKFDRLGGEGYYNVYLIGGRNPPIKYILQRWLTHIV